MATTSILVADESDERLRDLAGRIKGETWDVSTAPSAEAARRALAERPVGMFLADASVWNDGTLAEDVSREYPALPVIVLTPGDVDAGALIRHLKLGAMTFLPRQSVKRRLVDTIQSILDITRRNPYREGVKHYLRNAEIELCLPSDPSSVSIVVGFLQRVLEDYGLSGGRSLFRIGVAISEAISNAMIHGNLEVSSALRDGASDAYYEQIEQRKSAEPYASRAVDVIARFSESSATFIIRDQGKGFDRAALGDPDDLENLVKASGRGIMLMRAYADLVTWNEAGNEVTLVKGLTA